jgi:adenosylcobinamide-phosphate synthase
MADESGVILTWLAPDATVLAVAVGLDLLLGDPVYAWHPVRLIGSLLEWLETQLRAIGFDGYGGGIALVVVLSSVTLSAVIGSILIAGRLWSPFAWGIHLFVLYSLLALGDLLHHVGRIETAVRAGDLDGARLAVGALVGRDTDRLDGAACRRAAVESLSESLTDGFISPVCWYLLLGLPGLVLFKVVSTMDSMVGYRTPRYLRFGWCGARLDDLMNYLPARVSWLAVALVASVLPAYSGRKAWRVGLEQHAIVLGPNAGWSEAATAGALERRIVGPIWLRGELVTDIWIGDAADPPLATSDDVTRATRLVTTTGVAVAMLACAIQAGLY